MTKTLTLAAATIAVVFATGAGPALAKPGCPSSCKPTQITDGTSNTIMFGLMEEEGIFYSVVPR